MVHYQPCTISKKKKKKGKTSGCGRWRNSQWPESLMKQERDTKITSDRNKITQNILKRESPRKWEKVRERLREGNPPILLQSYV